MNVYCVILCRLRSNNPGHPRIKRFYLRADSANLAILTAADDNPQWRAIGIEPAGFPAPLPQAGRVAPAPVRTPVEYPAVTPPEEKRAS
jgi:hypothetical protein